MKLTFPPYFEFGTSTAAYQIETGFEHDWCGVQSRDGYTFGCTTDHEKQYAGDVDIISSVAPNYRMSLMWSRLQRQPFGDFDIETNAEYHKLLHSLRDRNVKIMMVLHHFANATWFAREGGWEKEKNIGMWIDFAKKIVDEYGTYVGSWNTFNEPNLYVSMGWALGEFPPFKKNMMVANRVIKNMAKAHGVLYDYIKSKFPDTPVGISHNCTVFAAENYLGELPARFMDWWYMDHLLQPFNKMDFFGMSYYARIGFDPTPITYMQTPGKIKTQRKDHDDMWEYYPEGLMECMQRYWRLYGKPIIITENGICTSDDQKRIRSIKDYMRIIHNAIANGIDIRGYYHWSTWDNFEWSLGPTYQFGLYECDLKTRERIKKPSADFYSTLAFTRTVEI
ncbi:MAG TPA: family 1 glycosylhydrolase [Ohtaekwangia sp.]|nr:family 1 glycosylhydrolase [Ohtaekwangia sp.]